MADEGKRELDQAFRELEEEVPDPLSRALRWLHAPRARKVRIPVGILFLAGGMLWFLPVLGLELIPIGLLLIAQDVPFLRKPVARALLWLEARWRALRRWWRDRRRRSGHAAHHRPASGRAR